jgi:DNA-binding winged helix-turn-helix (wHTH) protein/pimeloyl-ACP methyl ester carboxylesterase
LGVPLKAKHLYEFGSYHLDRAEGVLLRDGQPVTLPPKDLETLFVLVERAGHIVAKEELLDKVWPGVFVEEGNLARRIFNLRQVLGDSEDGRKYIETIPKRGYRFVAPVTRPGPAVVPLGTGAGTQLPRQEIRFCVTSDNVRLAWASVGSGHPLVKAANWLNHLNFEWESPIWKHWIAQLTQHHRLIRYDERGNGLSDWEVSEMSPDLWVRDLETVVDSACVDRFALMGISQGGAVAISYAVRHPERVSHLILLGAYSQGYNHRVPPEELEARRALKTLVRLNWGKNLAGFSEMFAKRFIADDAACEPRKWLDDLQRVSASPENAARVMEACDQINGRALLPRVSVPTIVFHCDGDRVVPAAEGRILAAEIPGARFVPLPGANHLLLASEPAWEIFVQELGGFLGWRDVAMRRERIS